MTNRSLHQRMLLLALCSCVYIVFFGNGDHRNLSQTGKKNLEYVRITHTGGSTIEKAAYSEGVTWGSCHFIKGEGCTRPDYRWYEPPTEPDFIFTNIWQTPPKLLKTAIPSNQNPYTNKDLFTVVRNPYARYVGEYYCPFNGGYSEKDGHDVEKLNMWIQRRLSGLKEDVADYKQQVADGKINKDIQASRVLSSKSFVPQSEYVYDDDGSRIIKNVLRFEDLRSEFKNLMIDYGQEIRLPFSVHESAGKFSFKDLWPETVQLINEFARSDFYAFGYEMVSSFVENPKYSVRAKARPCRVFDASDPEAEKCEVDDPKSKKDLKSTSNKVSGEIAIGRPHATTMLLGIFTDNTEDQVKARQRIRDTYLDNQTWSLSCPLKEYKRQFDLSNGLWVPCRIPYVFVVGGDPTRPALHKDNMDLSIERSLVGNATSDEEDMVYLNIADSKHHGKSQSYLKWAASFGYQYNIDFVAKVDPAALFDRQQLISFIDMELPPVPMNRRMYGGGAWANRGSYYATKSFYFMSMDLAEFMGDANIHEWNSENQDIGAHIFYHSKPIKFVNMNPNLFWFEDLDTSEKWFDHWKNKMNRLPRKQENLCVNDICKQLKETGDLWRL